MATSVPLPQLPMRSLSETAKIGAAAGHSEGSGRERCHTPLCGALPLRGPHPVANYVLFTVWLSQKQYGPEMNQGECGITRES